jgi:8-oxo-(d)GTP phosphatase
MSLFLVRHAQAGSRSDFAGDDLLRPLTGRGRHQAADIAGLVLAMIGTEPPTIRTSPYRRCMETVAPLGAAAGVEPIVDPMLAEGPTDTAREQVRRIAADVRTSHVVWCSHGDILPAVLEMLAVQDGLDLGRDARVQKGSIWVLDVDDDNVFERAVYLRPTC